MDYLKLFQNHSEYEAFVSGGTMEKPNVSHCVEENEVHYNPIPHDYSNDYLTFVSLEDNNTFYWNPDDVNHKYTCKGETCKDGNPISYSLDNGKTWNSASSNREIATINSGDKILLKAVNSVYSYSDSGYRRICRFSSIGEFNVYGNILSMIYGDDFANNNILNGAFLTFSGCRIVSSENLILPSEFGENGTISGMFNGCTSLTTAPKLPALTLTDNCYSFMFQNCTSLTVAPELPATTLAYGCYFNMFADCTGLTTAPELPATTLANECYNGMFYGCGSLITAPELPATTLADKCYKNMFSVCSSLTSEAIVSDSVNKPISSSYCAYMYCECPITTPNGKYDSSAYDCEVIK